LWVLASGCYAALGFRREQPRRSQMAEQSTIGVYDTMAQAEAAA